MHADDTKMLYRYLHELGGVCASHTSATSMGTDWRDHDPKVEPLVEIYQGDRMSYEIEGAPLRAFNCHCSRCRRGRSAAHATNYFYAAERFRWVRGEENATAYKPPEARRFTVGFCRHCGGALPYVSPELKGAVVPAGSLDSDPGSQPLAHIFVDSKADWFDITDRLPQYPELPPST